jgi:hypothetical protein
VRPEFNENVFNWFTPDLTIQQKGGVASTAQSSVEVGQSEWKDRVRLVAAVAADQQYPARYAASSSRIIVF